MKPPRSPLLLLVLAVGAALAALPAHADKRRAFVTSVTGGGNIAAWPGASGATALHMADAVCRARADAASLTNANSFRAWLSTADTDAYCHVQGLTGKKATVPPCNGGTLVGGGPWYLLNAITNFTAALDALVGPPFAIYRPVTQDENGDEVVEADLMTGTRADGTADSGTCDDWTNATSGFHLIGNSSATALEWTAGHADPCSATDQRLLCLEPGASEVTTLKWSPGAIVFVSSVEGSGKLSTWPLADGLAGLAAGDRICQNLAAAARLPMPQSFVAWLSDGANHAVDRLTVDGPFRRLDNFMVAGSLADLTDGVAANSLHVVETGAYLATNSPGDNWVWTGTAGDGTAKSKTCSNWTDPTSASGGTKGFASHARSELWTDAINQSCDAPARLYCFANAITLFWDGFEYTHDTARWSLTLP